MDREEIVIVGELPPLEGEFADTEAGRADRAAAAAGRISRFRESTRDERIEIARQAEHRYQRKVAWGARLGEQVELFTVASVPVMTRLRQPERVVLDTLVDSGVARSRSDALAWAVRLVGQHADEWLGELRAAMAKVDDLRAKGPTGEGSDTPGEQGQPDRDVVADRGQHRRGVEELVEAEGVRPGVRAADGVHDPAGGVERAADEQQHEARRRPRCAAGPAARTPRPSPARRRSAPPPRRARTATAS